VAGSSTLTAISTRESGRTECPTGRVYTLTLRALSIKDNGLTICMMAKELKPGMKAISSTRANSKLARRQGKAGLSLMATTTTESF